MATETDTTAQRPAAPDAWYSSSAEEVTAKLSVDPAVGLSSRQAADLLERNGPNALPVEQSVPGWKRFIGQYRSYMQVILVGAAIVSLAIKEWSTGVLLLVDHRDQRGGGPATGGQGRERDERAAGDGEGVGASSPRRL